MREWPARLDTFSTYRPGFEVRTRRLCRRVLMFHRFPELGEAPCLVASTDFVHAEDPAVTRLTSVVQRSYRRVPNTGWYELAALPMLEFEYSDASLDPVLHEIKDRVTRRNLPVGLGNFRKFTTIPNIDWQDPRVQLIDLSGDGFPDVLIDRGDWMAWYRKVVPGLDVRGDAQPCGHAGGIRLRHRRVERRQDHLGSWARCAGN
ncbi:MAG: hypothetical protein HC888_16370 [Candidatus Competibacteraceae bacterium]|nr:hypothetical protein [Candidatus Competibacteraceae bacterium]